MIVHVHRWKTTNPTAFGVYSKRGEIVDARFYAGELQSCSAAGCRSKRIVPHDRALHAVEVEPQSSVLDSASMREFK